jgi:hypothetical protein
MGNFTLCKTEREDYRYSGSENEEEEPAIAGEPSSIVQAPGGDTLRRNFQQIQVLIPSGDSLYNNSHTFLGEIVCPSYRSLGDLHFVVLYLNK